MYPCLCCNHNGLPFVFVQTTLLNHILTAHHGKRIAVIENEVRMYGHFFSCCCTFILEVVSRVSFSLTCESSQSEKSILIYLVHQ
jgi:hypothetical protein